MHLRRRPVGPDGFKEQLRCDRCGQPAIWRDRVVSPCCVLGEALCDNCESKTDYPHFGQDNFWGEVREDAVWFYRKLITMFKNEG